MSNENYHSDELNTCLPPKKGWIRHMSKPCTYVPTERFESPLTTRNIFASPSVCTRIAWGTGRWVSKSVDEVGFTVFHKNIYLTVATRRTITEADPPENSTIFYCRMSTIQPAWPVCTTSVCWHTCCWHFCSRSSHKTIPSLRELPITQFWTGRCKVIYLSIGFTQVFIMITGVG